MFGNKLFRTFLFFVYTFCSYCQNYLTVYCRWNVRITNNVCIDANERNVIQLVCLHLNNLANLNCITNLQIAYFAVLWICNLSHFKRIRLDFVIPTIWPTSHILSLYLFRAPKCSDLVLLKISSTNYILWSFCWVSKWNGK